MMLYPMKPNCFSLTNFSFEALGLLLGSESVSSIVLSNCGHESLTSVVLLASLCQLLLAPKVWLFLTPVCGLIF